MCPWSLKVTVSWQLYSAHRPLLCDLRASGGAKRVLASASDGTSLCVMSWGDCCFVCLLG